MQVVRRTVAFLLLFALILTCNPSLLQAAAISAGAAAPARTVRLWVDVAEGWVDGRRVSLDVPPRIVQGRTVVPLRFLAEALGATVTWEPAARMVTCELGERRTVLWIDRTEARVNGQPAELDVPPTIAGGRTMLPLRFVAEALGAEVVWSAEQRSIVVTHPAGGSGGSDRAEPAAGLTVHGVGIGAGAAQVEQALGQPLRRDPGADGISWWIYHQDYRHYVQVGLRAGKVAVIYSNDGFTLGGVGVGAGRAAVNAGFDIPDRLVLDRQGVRTIVPQQKDAPRALVDGVVVTFYFDRVDGDRLSAVLLSDVTAFWQTFSDTLDAADPAAVQAAYARQLLDLANTARVRRGLTPLVWDAAVAKVAAGHSHDMWQNGFFSHTSPTAGSLSDRFAAAGLSRYGVGENIAKGQATPFEAHEQWLNSTGHRSNMLNPNWIAFGAGVVQRLYTQNFTSWRS